MKNAEKQKWKIKYAVIYVKDAPRGQETTVEATDIVSALARFIREIQRPLERSGRVFMVDVISVERIIPEGGEKDGCS